MDDLPNPGDLTTAHAPDEAILRMVRALARAAAREDHEAVLRSKALATESGN